MERTQDAHLPRHRRALRCHATAAQRAYRRRRRHAAPRAVRMAALDVRSGCGSRGRDRGRGSLAGRAALAGSRAVPVLCQPYRRRGRPASGGRDAGVAARRHRVALCRRQGGRGADRAARRRGLFRRVARCAASLRRGDPRAGDPGAGHGLQCPALAGNPFTEVVLERGAVRLETPGGDNLVRLHPNQRAVYDARMGDMEVAEINARSM